MHSCQISSFNAVISSYITLNKRKINITLRKIYMGGAKKLLPILEPGISNLSLSNLSCCREWGEKKMLGRLKWPLLMRRGAESVVTEGQAPEIKTEEEWGRKAWQK
jgi:hypothetical protein